MRLSKRYIVKVIIMTVLVLVNPLGACIVTGSQQSTYVCGHVDLPGAKNRLFREFQFPFNETGAVRKSSILLNAVSSCVLEICIQCSV